LPPGGDLYDKFAGFAEDHESRTLSRLSKRCKRGPEKTGTGNVTGGKGEDLKKTGREGGKTTILDLWRVLKNKGSFD